MKRMMIGAVCVALCGTLTAYASTPQRWWAPGEGRTFPAALDYENAYGTLRTLLTGGELQTKGHAFFEPLGPNGRACVTCHQPADAMSLSVESARARWDATGGKDPLFAAYDGSNCPTLPQSDRASHALLLDYGLIRVERPWPPKDWSGRLVKPDYKIEIVRDPTGCNRTKDRLSVYRRPRPVSNMKYLVAQAFAFDPKSGIPNNIDPETRQSVAGNLMADNRTPSLSAQMRDAAATHLELTKQLTTAQRAQILDFEMRVFTAQVKSNIGGALDEGGAAGGPRTLAESTPGKLGSIGRAVWSEYAAWEKISDADKAKLAPEQLAFRQSVARGARVFREKTFLITDSAGINGPIGFGNPVRNSCVFCHNMTQMGNDVAPGQVDLGTTTMPFMDPAPQLPLFRIICLAKPNPYYGRVILTSDPGYALTTGKCADVGKITLQSNRGLAARAPYFSNGSAKDIRGIIDYYDRRYAIGYNAQEKADLVNLLGAL
jgi:hypothetical protein